MTAGLWGFWMMGLAGISSLGACADPVIVEPAPDGGVVADLGNGHVPGMALWSANPEPAADLIAEGPSVDVRRRWKRDPYYLKDTTGMQYLLISGSDYNNEAWSVSSYSQLGGTISNASQWTASLAGTAGTWYSGDITGPAIRYTATEKTLFFAANTLPTDPNRTRPDYVFQIGRAPSDTGSYKPASAPVLAVPTFTGTAVTDTPTTARADAYGVMDPWILDDGAGANVTMYYTGLDCAPGTCKFQIFRTVSTDGGLSFPPGSVVLSGRANNAEEAGGVAGPSVVVRGGKYILAYTAVKMPPTKSRTAIRAALTTGSINVAVGTDGITFVNASLDGAPVITRSGSYREEGCGAPSLFQDSTTGALRSYFSGYYNVAANGETYNIATADWLETK